MNHLRLDTSQSDRTTIWIDVYGRPVNVLSEPVFDELQQCLEAILRQRAHLPVVLRSAKPNCFVVGADLRRILAIESDEEIQKFLLDGQAALRRLEEFAGDSIAVVQGACLGGGLELALACRYRIACANPRIQLGMPEAKLGLMPGWGGTQRLIETVGFEAGMKMLLSGDSVDAAQALQLGLVDAIGDEAEYETVVTDFLRSLSQRPAGAVGHPRHRSPESHDAACEQLHLWEGLRATEFSPAQQAIVSAVASGLRHGREAGLRGERELFFALLTSAEAREKLQRFVH